MMKRSLFTRAQWTMIIIVLVLCAWFLGSKYLSCCRNSEGRDVSETFDSIFSKPRHGGSSDYYATPSRQVESFEFDPNEADSTQFLRLGLASFQVRSIYRYRAKGGRFSTPDDFRRVYRLTNEQWEHLSPLIRIAERYRLVPIVASSDERKVLPARKFPSRKESQDSLLRPDSAASSSPDSVASSSFDSIEGRKTYPRKFSDDETLDVNLADSALLCRVPGIGPYFARKIVDYRRRLGGYTEVEQLLQIENFPADAIAWLEISDTTQMKRLKVNQLTTRQLMKHPYMGYYRASEIMSYRRIYGRVEGLENLKKMPHFTEEDIRRLTPYLDFE